MAAPVITTPTPMKFGWIINATCTDASACEELKAAPAAGLSIIVDHLTLNVTDALTITIGAGDNGAGGVTTALIGAISMPANGMLQWDFPQGIALPAATALTVDTSGAGNILVFAWGRIQ
jgi:hypothetical protein